MVKNMLGVGHKPYVYTCRRTQFLDEFGKKEVLDGEIEKG